MSFPPIISSSPKVLILGSMPSLRSIDDHQYYAHPQNSFWWIMSQIIKFPLELDYSARITKVQEAGVCIWDVLNTCQRDGSLDSNIVRDSEVPNDIVGFLKKYSSISVIGFNGAAAKAIFKRHNMLPSYDLLSLSQLPSTSPAYASMKKEQKLDAWRKVIEPYLNVA